MTITCIIIILLYKSFIIFYNSYFQFKLLYLSATTFSLIICCLLIDYKNRQNKSFGQLLFPGGLTPKLQIILMKAHNL